MKKIKINKFTLLNNFFFCEKNVWEWDKKLFLSQIIQVVSTITMTYVGILIPVEIVRCIELANSNYISFLKMIAIYMGIYFICNIITLETSQYVYRNGGMLNISFTQKIYKKILHISYERLSEKEIHSAMGKVWNVLKNDYMVRNYVVAVPNFFIAFIGIIWFGSVVVDYNFIIFLSDIAVCALGFIFLEHIKKKQESYYDGIDSISRTINYVNKLSMDSSAGKDIRIFNLNKIIEDKYDASLKESNNIFYKLEGMYVGEEIINETLLTIFNIACYILFGIKVTNKEITVAEFVFIITIITQFSKYLNDFLVSSQNLLRSNISIDHINKFIRIKSDKSEGMINVDLNELGEECIIEFRNVCYTYEGAKEPVLKNINLSIDTHKKIAIIGLNGAGKTTLIKLLCGLYTPTSGGIFINNHNVKEIGNMNEIVATLFQDSDILPLTVDENITGKEKKYISENDKAKMDKALAKSNFLDKYNNLFKKGDSLLVKGVNEDASDLSGGEKQKLLFARALYKEAKIVVLDEPTAALDPIAERNLYKNFFDASNNVTSIFISHRLSSTVFCDEIVILSEGEIKEKGTHKELMKKNGFYANLYKIQSQYYKDEAI